MPPVALAAGRTEQVRLHESLASLYTYLVALTTAKVSIYCRNFTTLPFFSVQTEAVAAVIVLPVALKVPLSLPSVTTISPDPMN